MTSERTCMLVTSGDDGRLKAHPMTTQEADDHGDAWFIASSRSETVADIRARPQVNVSYAGSSSWLSIAGRATVVQDAAKKEELHGGLVPRRQGRPQHRGHQGQW